jgi:hypothetical protein
LRCGGLKAQKICLASVTFGDATYTVEADRMAAVPLDAGCANAQLIRNEPAAAWKNRDL